MRMLHKASCCIHTNTQLLPSRENSLQHQHLLVVRNEIQADKSRAESSISGGDGSLYSGWFLVRPCVFVLCILQHLCRVQTNSWADSIQACFSLGNWVSRCYTTHTHIYIPTCRLCMNMYAYVNLSPVHIDTVSGEPSCMDHTVRYILCMHTLVRGFWV